MTKPKIYSNKIRVGSAYYVPAIEYECMRVYAEYLQRRLDAYTQNVTRAKPVNWNGKTWPSLTALAAHCKTQPQTLRYYIKQNKEFAGSKVQFVDDNTLVY